MVKNEENAKKRCRDVKCILLQAHTTIFVQFVPTFNGNTIIYNLQSQIFMISATEGNTTKTTYRMLSIWRGLTAKNSTKMFHLTNNRNLIQ